MKLVKFNERIKSLPILWLVLVLALLLFVRSWSRLIFPEVWQEDGSINLVGFINYGYQSILMPVNGYLILIPRLVTALSASISITQYPLISIIFAWVIILATLVSIARAPILLVGGWLLAAACLLVPSIPEVYGLPLYTFWWTSLFLYISVFWDGQKKKWFWRAVLITLASLSSPVCLVVLPLFWIRSFIYRRNTSEINIAIIATITACIQIWIMYVEKIGSVAGSAFIAMDWGTIGEIIARFMGGYAFGNNWSGTLEQQFPNAKLFIGLIALVFLSIALYQSRRSWVIWALFYLWLTSIAMSFTRVNIWLIHPALDGPRYFFFPFILLSWWLIQIALNGSARYLRILAWLFLSMGLINTIPVLYRTHDSLSWKNHLHTCQYFDMYAVPILGGDQSASAWRMDLSGVDCKKLLARDPLNPKTQIMTFPYRVLESVESPIEKSRLVNFSQVISNEWIGSSYQNLNIFGLKTLGSYIKSDNDRGFITIRLKKGDKVWYQSGPNPTHQKILIDGDGSNFLVSQPNSMKWALLEFSNSQLPAEFTVRFVDDGIGWGEWSAIAIQDQ